MAVTTIPRTRILQGMMQLSDKSYSYHTTLHSQFNSYLLILTIPIPSFTFILIFSTNEFWWTVSSSIHCENSNCMWWSFPWTVRPIPEDVNTVESIDRVLFFNLCLECLKRLDSSNTDAIQPVTSDKDIGHAECMATGRWTHCTSSYRIGL